MPAAVEKFARWKAAEEPAAPAPVRGGALADRESGMGKLGTYYSDSASGGGWEGALAWCIVVWSGGDEREEEGYGSG
jgi:hypothetical protein